jgi:hypothetical protein
MNTLATISQEAQITMTSLELVDFINGERAEGESELRHDHFMVKVPKVLGNLAPKLSGTSFYVNGAGNQVPRAIYTFPKREACLMAMSYSYALQAKVFDRMTELEAKKPIQEPLSLSRMDILKLAMESEQRAIDAESARDLAIATKAQIGSKREATAMANVAKANKEVARLKDQLGFSIRQATILQVEDITGRDFDFLPLRRWCQAHEVVAELVPDKRYPKGVRAWPAAAWKDCYGIDLQSHSVTH